MKTKRQKRKQIESIDDYKPILREEGSMIFETYGDDHAFVSIQNNRHIWTLGDDDNGVPAIFAGYHYVNRIGYIITIKSWTDASLAFPYVNESRIKFIC